MIRAKPKPTSETELWRALGDPTRRAILDLLRQGPMTTGTVAERFELTRFGVMKHLEVLGEAGLLIVRREGRQRWNQLNPLPIHEIARRWLTPFESLAAGRLLRLKQHAETREEETMVGAQFRTLDIQLEVEIRAGTDVVWRSLTRDIAEWWPGKFYVGTAPKRFTLECRVGGRVYEDWGDGEGALFGTVTAFEENRQLQWAGDMSADYGGPARSVTTFRLKPGSTPGSTILAFRDTPFGMISDIAVDHLEAGWRWLLTDCLKPYLEEGRRPERPESVVTK